MRSCFSCCFLALVACCFGVSIANAGDDSTPEIRVLAWNVESGGAMPEVIASQLSADFPGFAVYALSEVSPRSFKLFASALGPSYQSVQSETGRDDRLQIIYDGSSLELVTARELKAESEYRFNDGNHRSPLVAVLKHRTSGNVFQVVVNHLARGNAELRTEQASGLREWARNQSIATIAIGDFNFDYAFATQSGNDGFAAMMRDGIWLWAKPEQLVDTNWADFNRDGIDDYPGSMLDFAFVAGPAKDWSPRCRVIVSDGDFPDDRTTSDHRPIELILTP